MSPELQFWKHAGLFALILMASWLAFYGANRALPGVRAGHEQIYSMQGDTIAHGVVFPEVNQAVRVAVFGDSRVQAGFKPDLFDELSGARAYSVNLGLPNERKFMREIETLVRRGKTPDIVVLTVPWGTEPEPGFWERLGDDVLIRDRLLPFRMFVRDLTLFTIRSLSRGGPLRYYQEAGEYVEQARRARGYFFIEGMSHFPNHRLPDDFRIDIDDVMVPSARELVAGGPDFERLVELRRAAGFRVVFAPTYYRETHCAPAPENEQERAEFAPYGIEFVGRAYRTYPNRLFSDPVHLNRDGADVYTTDLWNLLAPLIEAEQRQSTSG